MKLYDVVQLKEQFNNYPKGTTGVIVEIFENTDAYLEIVDAAGNTKDVIYVFCGQVIQPTGYL